MQKTNRELLMLAQDFDFNRHRVAGMLVSEKMDGMRCIWVPETKGWDKSQVPWANMEKSSKEFKCTGLWSRYGHPIMCPDWFTEGFPPFLLDGELWAGRGKHQTTMSAVKKHVPVDSEWEGITYNVFDRPPRDEFYRPGRINNPNYKYTFSSSTRPRIDDPRPYSEFHMEYRFLKRDFGTQIAPRAVLHPQTMTPFHTEQAEQVVKTMLQEVDAAGGEGLIVRYPGCLWKPVRSAEILKLKPIKEGEGVLQYYTAGLGKHEGRIGSIGILWNGLTFDLGGFTDEERTLVDTDRQYAYAHTGERMPDTTDGIHLHVGDRIRFEYRELSDDGVPKEARYKR